MFDIVKKIALISFSFLLLFISVVPVPDASANAALRITGSVAKKIILSNGSKAGIKYGTKDASEKAIKRWNLDLHEQTTTIPTSKVTAYMDEVNNATVIPYSEGDSKFGWGKVILSVGAFLTGADILYDIYKQFKSSYDENKALKFMEISPVPSYAYDTFFGYHATLPNDAQNAKGFTLYKDGVKVNSLSINTNVLAPVKLETDDVGDSYRLIYTALWAYGPEWKRYNTSVYVPKVGEHSEDFARFSEIAPNVPPDELPDYIGQVMENPTPDAYADLVKQLELAFPNGIPLDIPLDDVGVDTPPDAWNEPLPDSLPSGPIEPPGNEPPGDEIPLDPVKPKNPIPIAFILAFADLLVSIIMYIGRMIEFIFTIPFIPEIPIQNPAFQWVKKTSIMGVKIYPLVMSMASIGLSFLVFKAIRKVLP